MTDIIRRKAKPKITEEPAPRITPRGKNKLSDYEKATTPFGVVSYKRPGMDYQKHQKPTGTRPGRDSRKSGGEKKFNDRKFSPGPRSFPREPSELENSLKATIDREIPLAVERLNEVEKVLGDCASSILDLSERLQARLVDFQVDFAKSMDSTQQGLLTPFVSFLNSSIIKLIESSSFHDLSGQRIIKVRDAFESLSSLLTNLQTNLTAPQRSYSKAPRGLGRDSVSPRFSKSSKKDFSGNFVEKSPGAEKKSSFASKKGSPGEERASKFRKKDKDFIKTEKGRVSKKFGVKPLPNSSRESTDTSPKVKTKKDKGDPKHKDLTGPSSKGLSQEQIEKILSDFDI
ncbi:MAG: hypothetical protein LBF22_07600 [Deltaproteobacteria bacterium]|jgi:hypothetical protein|nr:hypothetical protein [Deltaproteobacteria bacterium]